MISKILDFCKSPQILLLIVMLSINGASVLLLYPLFKGHFLLNFLMATSIMGLPIFISWIIHLFIYKKNKACACGSGLAISIAGAYYTFTLLNHQQYQEANIALGFDLTGGFPIFLIPAGLIGGLLGYLSTILFKKP